MTLDIQTLRQKKIIMSILIYAESAEENSKVALSWLHTAKSS
jgi:hypothetical protein